MVVDDPIADDDADRLLRALADRTRRDIVRRTLGAQVSVSDLAERYDMSFAAVQKHVAVLEAAGLVHKAPQGRQRLVRADATQLARATALLAELERTWRDRIGRLDALLAAEPD